MTPRWLGWTRVDLLQPTWTLTWTLICCADRMCVTFTRGAGQTNMRPNDSLCAAGHEKLPTAL